MHACVIGQLRMERGDENPPVTQRGRARPRHWLGEDLDGGAVVGHARRADEDAAQRLVVAGEVEIRLEARELAAVGVAIDLDVGEAEVGPVEQDHPGAGAEDRLLEAPHRLLEPVEPHQPRDRRRLAARDHEPVEPVELCRQAHLDDVRAEPTQHRPVLAEVALEGEDADSHGSSVEAGARELPVRNETQAHASSRCSTGAGSPPVRARRNYQPRVSSSSLGSSVEVEMPTIGSPRPAETRARISASA